MRALARFVLTIGGIALFGGCGGSQSPVGLPASAGLRSQTSELQPASGKYDLLYSFKGYPKDGEHPEAGLIELGGTLYGSTAGGGAYPCADGPPKGCGTIFSMTPSGAETLLYSFDEYSGQRIPWVHPNGLIAVNDMLYGTTSSGGPNEEGTVFTITPSGKLAVLYGFKGDPDGAGPSGRLLNVNGTLYGMTSVGGAKGDGTVFSITTSGKESVLHSFHGYFGAHHDGEGPIGGLIDVGGRLYGTTVLGGAYGNGTLFAITLSGKESRIYNFNGVGENGGPQGGLVAVHGVLYGTTPYGGTNGNGRVFAIARSGDVRWMFSFSNRFLDGGLPNAPLVERSGTLYGTTQKGGLTNHGALFAITQSGQETVLYNFKGGRRDGAYPDAPLVNIKGVLYGTTAGGGANGRGTVFSFTP